MADPPLHDHDYAVRHAADLFVLNAAQEKIARSE